MGDIGETGFGKSGARPSPRLEWRLQGPWGHHPLPGGLLGPLLSGATQGSNEVLRASSAPGTCPVKRRSECSPRGPHSSRRRERSASPFVPQIVWNPGRSCFFGDQKPRRFTSVSFLTEENDTQSHELLTPALLRPHA